MDAATFDLVDFLDRQSEVDPHLRQPDLYRTTGGDPLFGYTTTGIARAAARFSWLAARSRFAEAQAYRSHLLIGIEVETLAALVFRHALNDRCREHVAAFLGRPARDLSVEDAVLGLYAEFTGETPETLRAQQRDSAAIYAEAWRTQVPDESRLDEAALARFYDGLPLPVASSLGILFENHLAVALRSIPVALAAGLRARCAVDFGGNTGLITSAWRGAGIARPILVDSSPRLLRFAGFRDEVSGISGIEYLRTDQLAAAAGGLDGQVDFLCCTEVLEHLLDVEGTADLLARLLAPGGHLFASASFAHPMASHLARNRRFAGKETELFASRGLAPARVPSSIPLVGNILFFRKDR